MNYVEEMNADLVGRKILAIRTATDEEAEALLGMLPDPDEPLTLAELEGGFFLYSQRDPEGIGPGWLGYGTQMLIDITSGHWDKVRASGIILKGDE